MMKKTEAKNEGGDGGDQTPNFPIIFSREGTLGFGLHLTTQVSTTLFNGSFLLTTFIISFFYLYYFYLFTYNKPKLYKSQNGYLK